MDSAAARRAWRATEPVHAMIYFAPEAAERYASVGLADRASGYFASRAAALGAVPAPVVAATFYNFSPALVASMIPAAWTVAPPDRLLDLRLDAADAALRRALGAEVLASSELARAAELAGRAAAAAREHLEGRPLFAAHSALPMPSEPHLALWMAQTQLREFRGDGHIAALVAEGLSGLDALVTHAASGEVSAAALKATRGWSDDQWAEAVADLVARGLIDPDPELRLTDEGVALRRRLEDATDRLALPAYRALGEDGCAELARLAAPLSRAIVDAGLIPAEMLHRD